MPDDMHMLITGGCEMIERCLVTYLMRWTMPGMSLCFPDSQRFPALFRCHLSPVVHSVGSEFRLKAELRTHINQGIHHGCRHIAAAFGADGADRGHIKRADILL